MGGGRGGGRQGEGRERWWLGHVRVYVTRLSPLPPLSPRPAQTLEFADVKKYGVAGTVAYVITELAFWILAFPAAAYALYNTTGHWPDLSDNADRAAVLSFIFAGANVARLAVPLRLGAALALAPWVDENLISNEREE